MVAEPARNRSDLVSGMQSSQSCCDWPEQSLQLTRVRSSKFRAREDALGSRDLPNTTLLLLVPYR